MNRYELTYIINTTLEETARKELVEKFTELIKLNGGEIEKVDESWGKRRLAYLINDMPEGYYVLTTFTASGAQNKEIQRNLENNDMILRYLIIKLLDKKQSVKPKAVRPSPVFLKEETESKGDAAEAETAVVETPVMEAAAQESEEAPKAQAVAAEPEAEPETDAPKVEAVMAKPDTEAKQTEETADKTE